MSSIRPVRGDKVVINVPFSHFLPFLLFPPGFKACSGKNVRESDGFINILDINNRQDPEVKAPGKPLSDSFDKRCSFRSFSFSPDLL